MAFHMDLSESPPIERRRIVWESLREELGEPRCHYCIDSDGEGACGWAYVTCKVCGEAFCADWFNRS